MTTICVDLGAACGLKVRWSSDSPFISALQMLFLFNNLSGTCDGSEGEAISVTAPHRLRVMRRHLVYTLH